MSALAVSVLFVLASAVPTFAAVPDGWSTPTDLASVGEDAGSAEIAVAPDNTLVAVWSHNGGSGSVIRSRASTDRGVTWAAPVDLTVAGQSPNTAEVVASPDGSFTAVWRVSITGDRIVQSSTSTDGGTTWSAPTNLSSAGLDASGHKIVAAPDGSRTVVWSGSNGTGADLLSASSDDGGVTWTAPVTLSAAGDWSRLADLAVGPNNELTAVWSRHDGMTNAVRTSTSVDGGATWLPAVALSTAGVTTDAPEVAVGLSGVITAIWTSNNTADAIVRARTSTDNGATWSAIIDISPAGAISRHTAIGVGPDGTVVAVWVKRVGANSAVEATSSVDGGLSWTAPVALSPSGTQANSPRITAAFDNSFSVIWDSYVGVDKVMQSSTTVDRGATWSPRIDLSALHPQMDYARIVAASDGALAAVWLVSTGGPNNVGGGSDIVQAVMGLIAPAVTSGTPPAPQTDVPYSFALTASGSPASTFAITAGSLPAGLTLSSEGVISGTPTTAGESTFTIVASNGATSDATASYVLTTLALLPPTGTALGLPLLAGGMIVLLCGAVLVAVSRLPRWAL
ncbi:putative Ig domain-containing protein [Rhodoglobus sp. NPDC076762]